MARTDLFTPVHKAIRNLLFETTALAARTAFDDLAEAASLDLRVRMLFAHLEEHQTLEDAVVMPELRRLAAGLWSELQNEHARIGGQMREIAVLLARIAEGTAAERQALGQRLQQRLNRLVAAQLVHLEREEVEANRVLWVHLGESELQALHGRILAQLEPARLQAWLLLMLPALARPERAQLLHGMRAKMPAATFARLAVSARAAIGDLEWDTAMVAHVA